MSVAELDISPTLNLIPRDKIDDVAPLITPHLLSVIERSHGQWTLAGMLDGFKSGAMQLWIIWNGDLTAVGATELAFTQSGDKLCKILFLTGEHSLDWLHLIDELEGWAKIEGCQRMAGHMRKGWAKRLPDYRMTHIYLEKELA
jgi:hypothetical protein